MELGLRYPSISSTRQVEMHSSPSSDYLAPYEHSDRCLKDLRVGVKKIGIRPDENHTLTALSSKRTAPYQELESHD